MRPLVLLLVAAVTLGACGRTSEADAVNVARTWLHAVRAGEETAACGLMAPGAARAIAQAHALDAGRPCADVVRALHARLGDPALDAALDHDLRVRGGVHAGAADVVAHDELVSLRRANGHWSVAGASALRRP